MSSRRRIFLVPLAYLLGTRLANKRAVASFIAIYPLPIALSVWVYTGSGEPADWLALAMAMLAFYGVYELGYMDNDTRTVRSEVAPTERLSDDEKNFYARARWWIAVLRLAFVAAACVSIELLLEGSYSRTLLLMGLMVILVVFPVYNSVRGTTGLPLHLLLTSARFCMPGMVLVPFAHADYFFVMWLAFPFVNLLERAGEPRYGLPFFAPFLSKRDLVRVVYYAVMFSSALGFWLIYGGNPLALVVFGWFLLVRLVALGLARNSRDYRADLA